MIDETKKTISINQAGIMLFISLVAFKVCSFASKLFLVSGTDFAISFLIQAVITILLIWFVCIILKKTAGKNLTEILDKVFGKVLSKCLFFILLFFFMFKLVFVDTELKQFLDTSLYTNLDYRWFLLPIIFVIGFLAFKGIRVIGRVGEILGSIGLITLVVCLVLALPSLRIDAAGLMFENGISPILNGMVEGVGMGSDFIFLLLVGERIAIQQGEKKQKQFLKIFLWGALALLLVTIFMFVCLFIFKQSIVEVDSAIVKITNASRGIATEFKLDGGISLLWLIMILLSASINTYCASLCFKKVLNLKSHFWGVVLCLLPVYVLNFFNSNVANACISFTNFVLPYISAFVLVVLVVLLLILILFKRKEFKNG